MKVNGTSNGVFSLIGDYTVGNRQAVVAGAYAYQLYQGALHHRMMATAICVRN